MTTFFDFMNTFLKPPVFEGDEEKTRDAKLLHQIIIAIWSLTVITAIVGILNPSAGRFVVPAGIILAVTLTTIMLLNRAGKVQLGSTILVGMVFSVATFFNYSTAGEPRPILLLSVIVIMMSGLLLGTRGPIVLSILLAAQHLIFVSLHAAGIITPEVTQPGPLQNALETIAAYLLIGFMFRLAIVRIQFAVSQLQSSNLELQRASTFLEERVEERTQALTTVAEVSTAASTILETDRLLQQVVDLAKERFGFYHAHIYLLNEAGDTLVLSSGAGEVGRQMVAEGRAIPLDREQSLVARAARERKGVTVNDVTQAPDFLPNALLPDTHSELAVPMMIGEQVIGVFDVQSKAVGRFTDTDIAVQTTLASQIAAAVQNARSYTKVREAEQLTRTIIDATEDVIFIKDREHRYLMVNEGYANPLHMHANELIGKNDLELGFPEELVKGNPEKGIRGFWTDDNLVFETGKTQHFPNDPVIVDGVIHILDTLKIPLRNAEGEIWAMLAFSRDVTEREHLHELTAQRARQQETINLVTQKIQSTITIEEALQVAAREAGHALGMKQTLVVLDPDAVSGERFGNNEHAG
jgi:GAF domain-containing protein